MFLSAFAFSAVSAFFMVNVEMPSWAYIVSGISILIFAAPSFWALRRWLGWRDSLFLLGVLSVFALSVEGFAVVKGFPYGSFSYSELLGFRLFGVVPWTVAFAWTPLILAAYAISHRLIENVFVRILSAALILIAFDLVLDPGAVYMGFWKYSAGGSYYGVPFSNFAGWLLSGIAGAGIVEIMVRRFKPLLPTPAQLILSAGFTVIFWTVIALFAAMVVPFLIGFASIGLLAWFYLRFHYAFDEMIVLVDEENTAISTAPKLATHDSETPLHRAFSVFLFNEKGELLLQKRAAAKKTWAGIWSNSCCGHLMLHETLENAAARRLKFELGLNGVKLLNILPDFRYKAEKDGVVENEICPVLVGLLNKNPRLNPAEVAEFEWISWKRFCREIKANDCAYSPWSILEADQLLNSPDFCSWFAENVRSENADHLNESKNNTDRIKANAA